MPLSLSITSFHTPTQQEMKEGQENNAMLLSSYCGSTKYTINPLKST